MGWPETFRRIAIQGRRGLTPGTASTLNPMYNVAGGWMAPAGGSLR